jgi:hypothetical protein
VVCDDWSVLEEVCRLGVLKSRWRLLRLGVTLSPPFEVDDVLGRVYVCM